MRKNYSSVPFDRYADDIIVHCKSQQEAEKLLTAIEDRHQVADWNLTNRKQG